MEALRAVGSKGAQVSRYKGLGEMNPSELWETTLDPSVRALYRVDVLDAATAETIFTDLMADNVSARRALIEKMCAGYKGPL
jgi:DNA gyrase subunit B